LLVLAAAMIVIPIVSWLWRQSEFWTVILIGGWIAIAAAHFVKPTQGLVAYRLYHAREPTPDERAKLHDPWQNVLARAGIPADRYRLMVSDRDDVNAYASGGYGVVVTSLAVRRLRPRQLEAVLAHELGHHVNLDLVPRVLMQQVLLPIRAVWWLGRALWTAIRAVGRGALASPSCLSVLLAGIVAIVALLLFRSLVAPAVIALAGAALGRLALDRAEYDADDIAVRLGVGSVLLGVLKMFERRQPQDRDRLEQTLGIKPLLRRRIDRLSSRVPEPPPAADPWERLLRQNHPSVAAELSTQAQRGELTDVDRARIGLTLRHAAAARDMEIAVRELTAYHGAAFLHRSGQRDLPVRHADHDLLRDQVRLGMAVAEPRNPDELQDQPFGLDTAMLTTSLLAIGPPGSGKTRGIAIPIVEHLCLAALANAASVVVIDPKGDDFDVPGMFDVEIDLANPDGSWGFDLYGGAQTAEEAADRLASALLPPEISGDKAYFIDASKNALYQALAAYDAAYRRYPTIRVLLGLLKGDERVIQSLRDKLASSGRLGEHEHLLAGREHQRRRRDDPAASLVERLGLLDRPSLVKLLDEKRHKFSMGEISQPIRVRIALPEALYPEAARILARLAVAQFVQVAASPRSNPDVFKGLIIDEAGRYVDDYVARGVQHLRSRNAGLVLLTQSLGDFAENLRSTIFGSTGCKTVFGGVDPRDAQYFADYWGTQWVEEVTRSASTGRSGTAAAGYRTASQPADPVGTDQSQRYTYVPGRSSQTTSHSEGSTTRDVERYVWSPSEIINAIPPGHALVSLARPDGIRVPPTLVNLRA
ncbi:MAG TPA: M48 family metalloprotease, partial [Actinomycetes bacterium]|nr:M48 family metalloprotease [Actinomycetes bacterium]